jgi:hypothetical protein
MAFGPPGEGRGQSNIKRCRLTSASDRLITDLVEDLEPVRPLPRLRQAFAIILALWATLLGVVLWTQEFEPGVGSLMANRIYFWSFAGLLVASCGGTISALAAGMPGRDRLEMGGMLLSLVGLGVAVVVCLTGMNAVGVAAFVSPTEGEAMCFRRGAFLSLLPAGVIFSFLVRGWAARPVRAVLIALLASGGIGAVIVQASCDYFAPQHLLIGHLTVPLVLAMLGVYPLGVILRRIRR